MIPQTTTVTASLSEGSSVTAPRPRQQRTSQQLIEAARQLRKALAGLTFSAPVTHVYNPLDYAWRPYADYLRKFANGRKRVVFLGMNPGPFGMAQTGVPFGEISAVRDWMKVGGPVSFPPCVHPRRPITGFRCARSEVSGRRLWGLFAERFGEAEIFSADHTVLNYCPLVFIESSGRNRTPDKLPASEKEALFAACDAHLRTAIVALEPEWLIGVGDFAAKRAEHLCQPGLPKKDARASKVGQSGSAPRIGRILHPSPASPAANRDWAALATAQLIELGVWA